MPTDNIIITHGVRTNITKLTELVECGKLRDFEWLERNGFHWRIVAGKVSVTATEVTFT